MIFLNIIRFTKPKCLRTVAHSYFYSTHYSLNLVSENLQNDCLTKVDSNLSEITSYYPSAFNLAAYVNSSETLQTLVELNVNLSKIEKKPHIVDQILKIDNDSIKKTVFFLYDYVPAHEIGNYITKNPLILCESLEDLNIRLNYLQSKHFSKDQIERIVTKNVFWLMFSTSRIDSRLGFFQNKFNLLGGEVRQLTCRQPTLITYNMHHITTNTFAIKEEMGFEENEMKQLILNKPKIWMLNQKSLLERFNYIHNTMKISHSMIVSYPDVLLYRNFKIKQRHMFLMNLGRAQYDPKKENYVPIIALAVGSDTEFCKKYARCNINEFNIFLKTI